MEEGERQEGREGRREMDSFLYVKQTEFFGITVQIQK